MGNKIKYPIIDDKKQCGTCGEFKTLDNFNKARNHYTSKCHDCLKIYAAEYRKRPEIKLRASQYHRNYKLIPGKREIINARMRQYNKTEKYKSRRNRNRRDWALEQKKKAINYMGGKCIVCGYNKCLAAMDFHHKDPKEKDGYGTGALKAHWTFEKNKIELDKCILVCVRCHREIHANIIKL